MQSEQKNNIGALERARRRLYELGSVIQERKSLSLSGDTKALPHAWEDSTLKNISHREKRHVRLAGIFFIISFIFFIVSLGVAGYLFYHGGNIVSVDKITIDISGPTTIASGDTVPLFITITNGNPIAIDNATIEIEFPNDTRSADGKMSAYPRYTENLGRLASGETITRSIKAIVFGSAGQTLLLPVSLSYETERSTSIFVKRSSYSLAVTSAPISLSVETLSETVSGKELSFVINVRSNATTAINNAMLSAVLPFGFTITNSSVPMAESNILLGTLQPATSKRIILTGILVGQRGEQRTFRFKAGTFRSANDQTLAITYMTQDATVTIVTPFIATTLSINGETGENVVVEPEARQSVTITYVNTLQANIENAAIEITLSGSAVDYNSIKTTNGFYRSADHTIIFNRDTDPSLATLAPGASGIGSFTFSTLPANAIGTAPTITFTVSVLGSRIGQANVPEKIDASFVKTVKVASVVTLSASSYHFSGPFKTTGPIPPRAGEPTTYNIIWNIRNNGSSSIADATVSAILPMYVSYNDLSTGTGSFSYDSRSRTILWSIGNIAPGRSAQGAFQITLNPSSSQIGSAPILVHHSSFSGYDRFAGVQISAFADSVTTDIIGDVGYVPSNALVQ